MQKYLGHWKEHRMLAHWLQSCEIAVDVDEEGENMQK